MRASHEKILPPEGCSFSLRAFAESKGFTAPWHFHPELELTLILESRGMRLVGDSVEAFAEGDLVLLGENLPHCWLNSTEVGESPAWEQARSLVLQFRPDLLGAGFMALPEARELHALFARARRGLRYTGAARDQLAARMQALRAAQGLAGMVGLLELLQEAAALAESGEAVALTTAAYVPEHQTPLAQAEGARIDRVVRFAEGNYARGVTLGEAAAVAGLSPAAFSRYFRAKIGMPFVRFLNELRVSHACRLLIESDLGVTEICFRCGFENVSNFNRRFRQIKGVNPSQFRRAARR